MAVNCIDNVAVQEKIFVDGVRGNSVSVKGEYEGVKVIRDRIKEFQAYARKHQFDDVYG